MPTANETLPNRALTGEELKELLRQDFERLLDGEGLLQPYIAYGRVGYEIILRMHLDNQMNGTSESAIKSRQPARNADSQPPIDTPPLVGASKDALVAGTILERQIDSPNEERIRAGMPIPVEVTQPDRTVTHEQVRYPKGYMQEELGEGKVKVAEEPEEMTRRGWNLLRKAMDVVIKPEGTD
jgi:hypothetical protein